MAAGVPQRDAEADDLRRCEAQVITALRRRFPSFDEDELADCWQQAFAELWPRAEGRPPTGLLIVAALRRASDHWRRYRSRIDVADPAELCGADPDADPALAAQREVDVQRGAELLAMLPPHHQRIWRAYCDTGARANPAAIAAIAAAEDLTPRQVTKVVEKVQEKARRIAAAGLNADLETGPAFCGRLERRIADHLAGAPDPLAERHLATCADCRAAFGRPRRIDRAAALLAPVWWLRDHLAVAKAAAVAGAVAAGGGAAVVAVHEHESPPPRAIERRGPSATFDPRRPGVAAVAPRRPTAERRSAGPPRDAARAGRAAGSPPRRTVEASPSRAVEPSPSRAAQASPRRAAQPSPSRAAEPPPSRAPKASPRGAAEPPRAAPPQRPAARPGATGEFGFER